VFGEQSDATAKKPSSSSITIMANESWDDDFTMSDASDCNSGIDRQLEMVPGQPSATSFQSDRLNETSLELLQTGASFEVGSNDNQPWTNNYQESFDGTLYWSETTTPHLHMVSNGPDDGFLQSGELAGSCVTDNSLLESNHPQMVYNDDNDWRSDNGYRTALPTFNFEHDSGTPSARQPLDVGQGSNDWYHNPPFRQTEPGTDDFSDQFVAGNMNFLPGEPQQHADSFDGNKLQSHNPNMYDQSDSNSAHPPPWNPLGLHATQSVAPRCPTCTFSASSSRGSTATHCSCSLLSYTGTIITTPDSAYTGVVEGSDTAWDTVSGGDMYQSSQYGLGSFGRGHSVVHGTQDRFHMSEAQAGLLSPHLDAGRIPRLVPITAIEINSI